MNQTVRHEVAPSGLAVPVQYPVQDNRPKSSTSGVMMTIVLNVLGLLGWIVFLVGLLQILMLLNGHVPGTYVPDQTVVPEDTKTVPVQSVQPAPQQLVEPETEWV